MSDHALLSPSSSNRWMVCGGSIHMIEIAEKLLGPEKSGPWAAAGSAAHALAERCLRESCTPEFYMDQVIYVDDEGGEHVVDAEMCDKVDDYLSYVTSLEGDLFIEQQVSLAPSLPEIYGTADAVICRPGHLTIVDLKTGYNVVDAHDNSQLLIYLIGAYIAFNPFYDFQTFTVVISQPPVNHHSEFNLDKKDLMVFASKLRMAVSSYEELKAENWPERGLVPDNSACKYCYGRSVCPALKAEVEAEAMLDFRAMKAAQLAEALDRIPLMEAWISGVKDASKELMLQGIEVPTYKVVEGRRTRRWASESKAKDFFRRKIKGFREEAFTHKFKSVAQIEKVLAKQDKHYEFTDLVEMKPGNPTVVPETDRRDVMRLETDAANDFKEFANEPV